MPGNMNMPLLLAILTYVTTIDFQHIYDLLYWYDGVIDIETKVIVICAILSYAPPT